MKKTELIVGTNNRDKLKEIRRLLKGCGFRVRPIGDFPGHPDPKETGTTFLANAKLKARAFARHTSKFTISDDSGLLVHALNGRPGVYSARFAGPRCDYLDNCRKVLRLLKGKKGKARKATFVSVVAIYEGRKFVGAVRGECPGAITEEMRGRNGFGYDPIFVPAGLSKTFAELSPAAKNRVSHRGRALAAAKKALVRYRA